MRLTKRKALELTIELWDWLAKNPSKTEGDWPKWKLNGGSIHEMQHDCSCCEYDLRHGGSGYSAGGCQHCPLRDYWPHGSCEPEFGSSPWFDWIEATTPMPIIEKEIETAMEIATQAATEIADLARRALSDYNKRYPIRKSKNVAT